MPISFVSITFIAALLAAHLIGDFVLQTTAMVERKRQRRIGAHLFHALSHAALAYLLAGYGKLWLLPGVAFTAHFAIDFTKELVANRVAPQAAAGESPARNIAIFAIDQLLHVLTVLAIALLVLPQTVVGFWQATFGGTWPVVLVVVCGAMLCINAGSFVIGILIHPFLSALENHAREAARHDANGARPQRGFPTGGRVIGQLERLLIYVLVLNGQYTAVGFLVAAKSIFRFGELNDPTARMESEYIIIGTMMSFSWAILTSWATAYMLQMFR
jgi:hypothetical protein